MINGSNHSHLPIYFLRHWQFIFKLGFYACEQPPRPLQSSVQTTGCYHRQNIANKFCSKYRGLQFFPIFFFCFVYFSWWIIIWIASFFFSFRFYPYFLFFLFVLFFFSGFVCRFSFGQTQMRLVNVIACIIL